MITNQYTYNGDGQRVQIVDSQGTKKQIWDFENILLETDGSDVTQVVYTLEPAGYGNLVSQRRGSTTSYYLYDALGSTRKLTDSAGLATDSYDYRAYGETYASSGSTTNVFRWVGQLGYYYDIDRSAYYLRARHYSPKLARFLSQDPSFSAQDGNLYRYGMSNPIAFSDPSGQIDIAIICACTVSHWQIKCDPTGPCGLIFAPPSPPPPQSPPKPGEPCFYPNRRVCNKLGSGFVPTGQCWESQCVCQCAGNSPGMNCVRSCIKCADNSGAPDKPWVERWCQQRCNLTHNERSRLNCCLQQDYNNGGCSKSWFQPAPPMNPNPNNRACTSMPIP